MCAPCQSVELFWAVGDLLCTVPSHPNNNTFSIQINFLYSHFQICACTVAWQHKHICSLCLSWLGAKINLPVSFGWAKKLTLLQMVEQKLGRKSFVLTQLRWQRCLKCLLCELKIHCMRKCLSVYFADKSWPADYRMSLFLQWQLQETVMQLLAAAILGILFIYFM